MSIEALAAYAAGGRGNVPRQQQAIALHAIDTLSVIAGGLATREGSKIARFYRGGDKALVSAGLAAVARFTECDDIHVPSCMTAGSIAIPIALEFATGAASFANATEAAYAVGVALAGSVGGVEALAHGVWPAIFAAPAVAAVATAVALESDETTVANAIALALAGASGRVGRPAGSPSGRWFLYGEAVLKGVRAAIAARQGFAGDLGLVTAAWLNQQTAPELAEIEILKTPVENAVEGFGLKPFVAARQGSNAIQAFLKVLDNGIAAVDIEKVEVFLPKVALEVVSRPLDTTNRLSTIANLGLQLGIAAFERDRLLDVGRERSFEAHSLALARRVILKGATQTHASYGWPARVRVHAGTFVTEEECVNLKGDPADPMLWKLVCRKFERFCHSMGNFPLVPVCSAWPDSYRTLRRVYKRLKVLPDV